MNYGPLILLYLKYCPYLKLISVKHINCKFIQWTEAKENLSMKKTTLLKRKNFLLFISWIYQLTVLRT